MFMNLWRAVFLPYFRLKGCHHLTSRAATLVGVSAVSLSLGCGNDAAFAPSTDPSRLLRRVEFAEHAYNLSTEAPYDTVRLVVRAQMADGTPAPGRIRYTSSDPAISIDSTGLLRVLASPLYWSTTVVVALTIDGQTRRDSAEVVVLPQPPPRMTHVALRIGASVNSVEMKTFSFARGWNSGSQSQPLQMTAWLEDSSGHWMKVVRIRADPVDTSIVTASGTSEGRTFLQDTSGFVGGAVNLRERGPGTTWVRFSTYAFGVTFKDSARVTIKVPNFYTIQSEYIPRVAVGTVKRKFVFEPAELSVPAGSDVSWTLPGGWDSAGPGMDIKFDEPQYALPASIPPYVVDGQLNWDGFWAYGINEHGGSGDIAPFRYQWCDTCDVVTHPNTAGAEARRFVRPGRYPFHTSLGASGVLTVTPATEDE